MSGGDLHQNCWGRRQTICRPPTLPPHPTIVILTDHQKLYWKISTEKTLKITVAECPRIFWSYNNLISTNSVFWRKMKMGSDVFSNNFDHWSVSPFILDLPVNTETHNCFVITGKSKIKQRKTLLKSKLPRVEKSSSNIFTFFQELVFLPLFHWL